MQPIEHAEDCMALLMRAFHFVACLLLISLSPSSSAVAAGDIFLGEYRLIVDDEPQAALQRSAYGTATFAYSFVSEVGGVNFQSTTDKNRLIPSLTYDASKPDGRRLRVKLGEETYTPRLYDWQLKPIVAYADSAYTAIVSLFGPGPNRSAFFYIQYHPAFQNTLLGLRLLQADMLLMNPVGLRHIPRNENGLILGPGEKALSEPASEQAATQLASLLSGKPRGSWVFCDVGVEVKLATEGKSLEFSGQPFYYFWHPSKPSEYEVKAAIIDWMTKHPDASSADKSNAARDILKSLVTAIPDDSFTTTMKDKYSIYLNANETVYRSALYVSQYSALFRGVRGADRSAWKAFVDDVSKINLAPFRTPTRMPR